MATIHRRKKYKLSRPREERKAVDDMELKELILGRSFVKSQGHQIKTRVTKSGAIWYRRDRLGKRREIKMKLEFSKEKKIDYVFFFWIEIKSDSPHSEEGKHFVPLEAAILYLKLFLIDWMDIEQVQNNDEFWHVAYGRPLKK